MRTGLGSGDLLVDCVLLESIDDVSASWDVVSEEGWDLWRRCRWKFNDNEWRCDMEAKRLKSALCFGEARVWKSLVF